MTTTTDSSWLLSVQGRLATQAPFSLLTPNQLESWFAAGVSRRIFQPGERLLRPDELKIWNNWPEIVGTVIAKNTNKLQLKGNTLYIYVESAPLKSELTFHRSVILQKINTFFGKQIVKEINIK